MTQNPPEGTPPEDSGQPPQPSPEQPTPPHAFPPPGQQDAGQQPGGFPPPPPAPGYGQQPPAGQDGFPGSAPPPPPGYGQQPPAYGQQPPGYGQQPPAGQGGFPGSAPPPPPGFGGPSYGGGGYGQDQAPFSVGTAISYGWNAFKRNAGLWIGAFLLVALVSVLVNFLLNPSVNYAVDAGDMSSTGAGGFGMVEYTLGGQLLAGLSGLITYLVGAVLVQGAIHKVNGRFDGFGAFFRFDHAAPLFTAAALLGLVSLVLGLLSIVTPFLTGLINIVWGVLSVFVLYIAADRGVQPVAAVQQSIQMVTSNLGSVIVLWLATIGLSIAGVIVICFTGLVVVVPLLMLAWAFAYKRLSGQQVAPV